MHPSQLAAIMASTGDPSHRSDGSRRSRTGGYHSRPGPTRQEREASWPSDAEFELADQRERDKWNSKYGGRNKWKGVTLPTGVKPHHMESRDRHGNKVWPPPWHTTHYRHGYKKGPKSPDWNYTDSEGAYRARPENRSRLEEPTLQNEGSMFGSGFTYGHIGRVKGIEGGPWTDVPKNKKVQEGFVPLHTWMYEQRMEELHKTMSKLGDRDVWLLPPSRRPSLRAPKTSAEVEIQQKKYAEEQELRRALGYRPER